LRQYLIGLLVAACAGSAYAAPTHIDAVYDLYRNGLKLGQVTDRLTVENGHYRLVSESRATGALALLWRGPFHLERSGEVTADGLKPTRFSNVRSDKPEKTATAIFDWPAKTVSYHYRDRDWSEDGLAAGAQDQLTQLYQFAWMKTLPASIGFQVVSGKNRTDYRYAARDGGTLSTPLGRFATRLYDRVGQDKADKSVSVWIAPGKQNLPLQVKIVDDGVTMEQRLVSVSVKD